MDFWESQEKIVLQLLNIPFGVAKNKKIVYFVSKKGFYLQCAWCIIKVRLFKAVLDDLSRQCRLAVLYGQDLWKRLHD